MRIFVLFLILGPCVQSQIATERKNSFAVYGGMGINVINSSEIVEYINSVSSFSQRVDDYTTAVDFFGGVEFPISEEWGIKIEFSNLFKSYSVLGRTGGLYDIFYFISSPSLLIQKVFSGKGYFLKIGAGGGYRSGYFSQKISTFGVTTEFTSKGWGLISEAVAQTAFGEDFFGYIGGSIGLDFGGSLNDSNGNRLTVTGSSSSVSLKNVHAGIRFGITQYF